MPIGRDGPVSRVEAVARQAPLWVWYLALQWLDVVWALLILFGIEHARIRPGFTESNAFDLYDWPYSHGLVGALLLSAVFGGVVAGVLPRHRRATFALVTLTCFAHWGFALLMHPPDLPLIGDSSKLGLGLWRSVAASLPVTVLLFTFAGALYAHLAPARTLAGAVWFGVFLIMAIGAQIWQTFGPDPSSARELAVIGLIADAGVGMLAAWTGRMRANRPLKRRLGD